MYVPESFRESRPEVLHEIVRRHPFGTLVSPTRSGLFATHIPFLLDPERGPHGTLLAHVARANPHWRELPEAESLAIFQGPHAYVSPRWYATPVAVPTWNYAVVHARGRVRLVEEPAAATAIVERTVRTFDPDWPMPDDDYVAKLMNGVVAFELEIEQLEGKLKLSQNRSAADRAGVVAGLRARGGADDLALADLMAP